MLTDLQIKLINLESDIKNDWETSTIQMKGIVITDKYEFIKSKGTDF